jgi:cytochrome d ubiquinol oxidase subunit II
MAIVLGAALGNVLRGVDIDRSGFFQAPLFTDFRVGPHPGVLDWYTVLIGVFAFVSLTAHGALYLAGKTTDEVRRRSRDAVRIAWPATAALGLACIVATWVVRPSLYTNLLARPLSWPLPLVAAGGLVGVFVSMARGHERTAFFCSSAFLAGTLASTAAGFFPLLLPSTVDPALSLTAPGAAAGAHGLRVALAWWLLGMPLAVAYAVFLFRSMRGRVSVGEE